MWREMQGLDLEAYNLAARATRLSSHLNHLSHASHSASELTALTYFSLEYFSVLARAGKLVKSINRLIDLYR